MPPRSRRSPARQRPPATSDGFSNPLNVKRIAIVGTGTIGSGWAAVYLATGFSVTAFVRTQASEDKFYKFLQSAWHKLLVRGIASDPQTR